ncbi:hypothetical protein LXL04_035970 [Taraxacum kok-saghyz]
MPIESQDFGLSMMPIERITKRDESRYDSSNKWTQFKLKSKSRLDVIILGQTKMERSTIIMGRRKYYWFLWRFRNDVVYDAGLIRKSVLFDCIREFSFCWVSNRQKRPLVNWTSWLQCPLNSLYELEVAPCFATHELTLFTNGLVVKGLGKRKQQSMLGLNLKERLTPHFPGRPTALLGLMPAYDEEAVFRQPQAVLRSGTACVAEFRLLRPMQHAGGTAPPVLR